eukprot:760942-Hanusia_phi.AAC.4
MAANRRKWNEEQPGRARSQPSRNKKRSDLNQNDCYSELASSAASSDSPALFLPLARSRLSRRLCMRR